jgi:hypothetical protein
VSTENANKLVDVKDVELCKFAERERGGADETYKTVAAWVQHNAFAEVMFDGVVYMECR